MSKQRKNKKTFITGADIRNRKERAMSAFNRDRLYGDGEEKGFIKHEIYK